MKRGGYLRSERGTSLVEMALALPVLLTVIFGIAESGSVMLSYSALADAARAGTRYAVVHGNNRTGSGVDGPSGPSNTLNVVAAVKTITRAAALPDANVTVTVTYPSGNGIGAPVTVTVSYPFNFVLPVVVPFRLLPIITLGSTSQGIICF
jgi:Flp pilus assembly protein TadG